MRHLVADAAILVLVLLPAKLGAEAHSSSELARLAHEIVRPGPKAVEHGLPVVPRCQHDDGNSTPGRRLFDAPARRISREAGHHEIEQHAVDGLNRHRSKASAPDVAAITSYDSCRSASISACKYVGLSSTARILFGPYRLRPVSRAGALSTRRKMASRRARTTRSPLPSAGNRRPRLPGRGTRRIFLRIRHEETGALHGGPHLSGAGG